MKMAIFVDTHIKMSLLSIKRGVFVDRVRDICYIHMISRLCSILHNRKYKLTLYKMAEFKDEIPILIHLFEVDKYRFCK